MNEKKLALLKRMYKERKLTLNEMAQELGVSFHEFKKMRFSLGLQGRYIKIKKAQIELTPEQIAERAAEVRAKHLAYKKQNGRPEFRPSDRPGYKFCGKNWRFDTFET